MQIYYCEKCGLRIQQDDLNSGRARVQESNTAVCPACAVVPPPSLAPEPVASLPLTVASPARAATQTSRMRREQSEKSASPSLPVPLLAAGGVVLLAVVILLFRGSPDSVVEKSGAVTHQTESKPIEKPTASVKSVATSPIKTAPVNPVSPVKTEPETVVAPKAETVVDFREGYAARRWTDLKSNLEKPGSEWSAALSIPDFIRTYGGTASGREAAEWFKKEMGSVQPTAAKTVAGYRRDFEPEKPKHGWGYLWNEKGALGKAAHYSPLVWNANKQAFSGDSNKFPCPPPVHYTYASQSSIHPGPGTEQKEPFDRYFIAAYTVQPGQEGRMALSVRLKRLAGSQSSVEIQVLVNDTPKGRVDGTGEEMNGPLGVLKAGDTIYVAIGPNRNDGGDGSELDFSINKSE